MKYSIPFNGDPNWVDAVGFALGDWSSLDSVYLQSDKLVTRDDELSAEDALLKQNLQSLLPTLSALRVRTILKINGRYILNDLSELIDCIERLYHQEDLYGIDVGQITILGDLNVKNRWPGLVVHGSMNSSATNIQQASRYIDASVDVLMIPPAINRHLDTIQEWKRLLRVPLKARVNEWAVTALCVDNQQAEDVIKSPWIRPDDTSAYERTIDIFEIAGQAFDTSDLAGVVAAYKSQKFSGDLRNLIDGASEFDDELHTTLMSEEQWQHCVGCRSDVGECELCGDAAIALARGRDAPNRKVAFTDGEIKMPPLP